MKEQFVTYEIALKLKELGFDDNFVGFYWVLSPLINNNPTLTQLDFEDDYHKESKYPKETYINAPLWQQVIDWFREKHKYHIDITFREVKGKKIEGINSVYFDIEIYHLYGGDAWKTYSFTQISDNFYYAREQAILKAIELCQKITKKQ